jgi:WhiB family transcriptional regulator, redox-sensing transcriptional regulator
MKQPTDQAAFEAIPIGEVSHSIEECFELLEPPDWHADALCSEYPQLSWFDGWDAAAAKSVCQRCLVRDDCLHYALDNDPLVGIWGGLTPSERRRLGRRAVA